MQETVINCISTIVNSFLAADLRSGEIGALVRNLESFGALLPLNSILTAAKRSGQQRQLTLKTSTNDKISDQKVVNATAESCNAACRRACYAKWIRTKYVD
jgi:hypothetical protein